MPSVPESEEKKEGDLVAPMYGMKMDLSVRSGGFCLERGVDRSRWQIAVALL